MELPDYWLSRPGVEPGPELGASFDRVWEGAIGSGDCPMVEVPHGERWQFLCHLADTRGVVLHGSGHPGISVFEPRQLSVALGSDEAPVWGRRAAIACRVPVEVRPFD